MVERKFRIEDALNATRAAVEEGILPGGGAALVLASKQLDAVIAVTPNDDRKLGMQLVAAACKAPMKQIVTNSGENSDVVMHMLVAKNDSTVGYDALKGEFVNMHVAGIIDPLKVCRTALENASSVATVFLSLDAVILDDEA